jgi:hypothetical protein
LKHRGKEEAEALKIADIAIIEKQISLRRHGDTENPRKERLPIFPNLSLS